MTKGLKTKTMVALAGAAVTLASSAALGQEAIRIGTSSVGSVFYTIAIGASEIIHKHGKLNTNVEPVGGSSANMRGLAANKIEFALANAFASFSAYNGTHNFKKPIDVRMVVQGQSSFRSMLLRTGAKITRIDQLVGRTVIAKRRALPEIELVMDAYIKAFKLPKDKIKTVATTNSPQAYKAIRAGSVDAALMPFSRRAAAVAKPMTDGVIDFLYISKDKRDEMLKHLPPMFFPALFKVGTYKGQKKDVHLVGLNTYFMTRPGVSDATVYKVTKAILENTKEFMTYHKAARQWTLARTLKNVALPFHPGAVKYFKEKGVWTAAHAANQKKLLAR